jgi:hypothetical protein
MITKGEMWAIMQAYGEQIMPIQYLFYIVGILLVGWLFLKPARLHNFLINLYLTIAFVWNAIVFELILARDMARGSSGNYFVALMFIIVAVLFLVDSFRKKMQFFLPTGGWRRYATMVLMLLIFCYPLFGLALGHEYSSLIMPGTFPCPTTALGLLLLTMALPQVDKIIYILLLFCAIPYTALILIPRYGVYEDTILLTVGLYGLVLLVRYWKAGNMSSLPD